MNTASVHRNHGGFSLLEVLVASAVLSVVLMVLLGVLTTTLNIWRSTEGKGHADREARAAELLIVQDLDNILVPADPNLWPRLQNDRLQFLTLKPRDYQSEPGDVGDVTFVEYYFDHQTHRLMRAFIGSRETFESILRPGRFPTPDATAAQILADNILPDAADAVRGLAVAREANRTNFVFLGPNLLPLSGPPSAGNFPRAIEVNFAVTDPQSIDNLDLLSNPAYRLRNAGLYSFRIHLPEPSP
jgi:prepilin-type N-terminal cleavage/methylation domain-containing protein